MPSPRAKVNALSAKWTPKRKETLLLRVLDGLLTREEACRAYRISPEEFGAWEAGYKLHGRAGLYVRKPKQERTP